jgi:hypothetical protein
MTDTITERGRVYDRTEKRWIETEVQFTIDWNKLRRELGQRAIDNVGGRTSIMGGAIAARIVRIIKEDAP